MNAEELKERTKQFALRVMHLVDALPKSTKARAIANQIIRSGTSVAANYRAACRARSRAEFVSKVGVVEEESDETALWLELIIADQILPNKKVQPLLTEANELVAIMASSVISARANQGKERRTSPKSEISNQKSAI
ncbi:MAG: four helix bundle protein [Chthoniobacterales bacterium]|nr:four helix bundle protein [Chthoniobacterales bacterium]